MMSLAVEGLMLSFFPALLIEIPSFVTKSTNFSLFYIIPGLLRWKFWRIWLWKASRLMLFSILLWAFKIDENLRGPGIHTKVDNVCYFSLLLVGQRINRTQHSSSFLYSKDRYDGEIISLELIIKNFSKGLGVAERGRSSPSEMFCKKILYILLSKM